MTRDDLKKVNLGQFDRYAGDYGRSGSESTRLYAKVMQVSLRPVLMVLCLVPGLFGIQSL